MSKSSINNFANELYKNENNKEEEVISAIEVSPVLEVEEIETQTKDVNVTKVNTVKPRKKREAKKTKDYALRIKDEYIEDLIRIAEENDDSINTTINRAIKEYIKNHSI